jgi:hypothetical protein
MSLFSFLFALIMAFNGTSHTPSHALSASSTQMTPLDTVGGGPPHD